MLTAEKNNLESDAIVLKQNYKQLNDNVKMLQEKL